MAAEAFVAIHAALDAAAARLAAVAPEPRLEAERLLAGVLGWSRARVLAEARAPLSGPHADVLDGLVARRAAGEPLAYLLGRAPFLDLELRVTPDVLIPRPETEALAAWAISRCAPRARVLDVGTGSGALALAIAAARPEAEVWATDVSEGALAVAAANARRLGLQVRLQRADLLPSGDERFDLVVANLPYVGTDELDIVALDVIRHEPHVALFAGPDGLSLIRRLLEGLPSRLRPGASVGLETGWRQGAAVAALVQAAFAQRAPERIRVLRDEAGHDRIVVAEDLA